MIRESIQKNLNATREIAETVLKTYKEVNEYFDNNENMNKRVCQDYPISLGEEPYSKGAKLVGFQLAHAHDMQRLRTAFVIKSKRFSAKALSLKNIPLAKMRHLKMYNAEARSALYGIEVIV